MKRFKTQKAYLVCMVMMTVFISILSGCGGGGSGTWTQPLVSVVSIAVTPATVSIPVNGTQQYQAMATLSDGSPPLDVTAASTWTSGTTGVTFGLIKGLATGTTANVVPVVITASYGGKNGSANLTVTSVTVLSISVTPATASIPVNGTQQYQAMATLSDGSPPLDVTASSTWTSGTTGVTFGLIKGLATGTTANVVPVVITASYGGKNGTSASLTVTSATVSSISVTPVTASIPVNGTQQYKAMATLSDGSPSLDVTASSTWTSGTTGVTFGLIKGLATGTTANAVPVVITASYGGKNGLANLTVTAVTSLGPKPVDLLSISTNNFVILSTSAITDTLSHTSKITGNIGLSPATAAAIGVFCIEMTGNIYGANLAYVGSGTGGTTCFKGLSADNTTVGTAVLDMGTAYTAASAPATPAATDAAHLNVGTGTPGTLNGQVFPPGTYTWNTPGNVNITGDITLTGSASDVWIFQMSGNLNLASAGSLPTGIHVLLGGTAKASNVFWQVGGGSGATLGTYSTFRGTILSASQVVMQTGSVLNGRALAKTAVTLDVSTVGP